MPNEPEKVWGLGIEHEFNMYQDDGTNFTPLRTVHTLRGGYGRGGTQYFYTNEGTIQRESDIISGVKKLVKVGNDGTIGEGGNSGSYEINTHPWKRKTIEQQVKILKQCEDYITQQNQIPYHNKRVRYMPFGSLGTSTKTGTGSFHFHITLPESPTTPRNIQLGRVKKFIGQVQWLQPLLIGVTHGLSPKSIGDSGSEPEGSIRMARNNFGNPGGTDIKRIGNHSFGIDRSHSSNFPKRNQTNHFSMIARVSSLTRKGGISDISRSGPGGPATMEIRVFDQFDSKHLPDFLKSVMYAGSNGADRGIMVKKRAASTDEWNKAMAVVLEEGWNAILPKEYIKKLRSNMGLTGRRIGKSLRCVDVLDEINKELYNKNKDNEIPRLMMGSQTLPKVYPVNRDGWNFYFKRELRASPMLRNKFNSFLKALSSVDTSESRGFITVGKYDNKTQGVRHLLHQHMGLNYSSEDTRDILDLLESEGLVTINRNPDGTMNKLKLHYNESDFDTKFNKLVSDARFLSEEEPFETQYNATPFIAGTPSSTTSTSTSTTQVDVRVGAFVRLRRDAELPGNYVSHVGRRLEVIRRRRSFRVYPAMRRILVQSPQNNEYLWVAYNWLEPWTDSEQQEGLGHIFEQTTSETPSREMLVAGDSVRFISPTGDQPRSIGIVRAVSSNRLVRVDFPSSDGTRVFDVPANTLRLVSTAEVFQEQQPSPRPSTSRPTPHPRRRRGQSLFSRLIPGVGDRVYLKGYRGRLPEDVIGNPDSPLSYSVDGRSAISHSQLKTIIRTIRVSRKIGIVHSIQNESGNMTAKVKFQRNLPYIGDCVYIQEIPIDFLQHTQEPSISNTIPIRQVARKMSVLKTLVLRFLRAGSTIQQERDLLGWINDYSISINNPQLRSDYVRALNQYNSAKESRRQRTGRRYGRAGFATSDRLYKSPYGKGWYVKNKDDEVRRVEVIRHRIAAIKGAKRRKYRKV